MARRRQLNKRVVILLGAIGAVAALAVAAAVIYRRLPKDPDALARRAERFRADQRWNDAVRDLNEAAQVRPDPELYTRLGKVLLEQEEKDATLSRSRRTEAFRQAYNSFRTALRYDARHLEAQRELTKLDYLLAVGGRDWAAYVASADKLLALTPDDHETLLRRARAKRELALTNPVWAAPAVEDYQALIEKTPDNEDPWIDLAAFQVAREQPRDVVTDLYERGLKANPRSVRLRVAYSQVLRQYKQDEKALALLKEAIELEPKEADGYLALAGHYQRHKEPDQALILDTLQRAKKANPGDYRAYVLLAGLAAPTDPQKAEELLVEGIRNVRESVAGREADLKGRELRMYREGILMLNSQLCDALLDGLGQGPERDKTVARVQESLAEIRKIAEATPYVAKIQGRIALADGKFVEAEKLLREAYEAFGGAEFKTAQLLSALYYRLRQLGEAEKIIERYLVLSGGDPSVSLSLVKLYIEYRQYDRAAKLLVTVLKARPEDEEALAIKAGLDIVNDRIQTIPESVTKLNIYTLRLISERANRLWQRGDPAGAINLYLAVLKRDPRNPGVMAHLIQWFSEVRDTANAQAIMKHAESVLAGQPQVVKSLRLLLEGGGATDINRQLEIVEQTVPDPFLREMRKADVYLFFRKNAEYLAALRAAEAKDPVHPVVLDRLFAYYLGAQRWDQAEKYAKAGADANIDEAGGKMLYARLAAAQHRWDEAVRLGGEVVEILPRYSQGHSFLGDCLYMVDRIADAKAQYDLAYQQNPSNVRALLGLINVSKREGRTADADHYIKLAYEYRPNDPVIQEEYLARQEARERPEVIIPIRQKILKDRPNDQVNLERLAGLYERVGDNANAYEALMLLNRVSRNSPQSVRLLADFLRRTNQEARASSLLAQFVKTADDKVGAYIIWANHVIATGEYSDAKAIFEKAIQANPDDGRGYVGQAELAARQRKWDEAVDLQNAYLRRMGAKAPEAARRAVIPYLIEAGRHAEAEQKIAEFLQADTRDKAMLVLRGWNYLAQRKFTEARSVLDDVLRLDPEYTGALQQRARLFLATGQPEKAAEDLEAVRRVDTSPWVAIRLARLYDSLNNFDKAQVVLQSVLNDRPAYPPALDELIKLCNRYQRWTPMEVAVAAGQKTYPRESGYYLAESEMWVARGRPDRAIAALQRARELAPNDPRVLLALLAAQAQGGDYPAAEALGRQLQTHPQIGPSARAILGSVYAAQNKSAEAEAEFVAALNLKAAREGEGLAYVLDQIRRAYQQRAADQLKKWLSHRPDDPQMTEMIGTLLLSADNFKESAEYLNKAVAAFKTDDRKVTALRNLGVAYARMDRYDDAAQAYRTALQLDPRDGPTLNNYAWLLAKDLKKPDEALLHVQEAVEVMPNSAHAWDTYGLVLMAKGDPASMARARELLRRSIDIQAMPANLMHMGEVLQAMGQKDEALREYRRAWELVKDKPASPEYKPIQEALKGLGESPATERTTP